MSDRRGTSRGACSSKVLSEDVGLEGDVHADALVEARRAGLALGVDPEPDPSLSAAGEVGEHGAEEELADAPAAPRAADTEHADPAHLEAPADAADGCRDLAPVE